METLKKRKSLRRKFDSEFELSKDAKADKIKRPKLDTLASDRVCSQRSVNGKPKNNQSRVSALITPTPDSRLSVTYTPNGPTRFAGGASMVPSLGYLNDSPSIETPSSFSNETDYPLGDLGQSECSSGTEAFGKALGSNASDRIPKPRAVPNARKQEE